jgi:hypothetical protein
MPLPFALESRVVRDKNLDRTLSVGEGCLLLPREEILFVMSLITCSFPLLSSHMSCRASKMQIGWKSGLPKTRVGLSHRVTLYLFLGNITTHARCFADAVQQQHSFCNRAGPLGDKASVPTRPV